MPVSASISLDNKSVSSPIWSLSWRNCGLPGSLIVPFPDMSLCLSFPFFLWRKFVRCWSSILGKSISKPKLFVSSNASLSSKDFALYSFGSFISQSIASWFSSKSALVSILYSGISCKLYPSSLSPVWETNIWSFSLWCFFSLCGPSSVSIVTSNGRKSSIPFSWSITNEEDRDQRRSLVWAYYWKKD